MSKQIFGREPAVIVAAIQAFLALLLSFGWLAPLGLSTQTDLAALVTVLSAAAGVYLALGTTSTLLAPVLEFFKAALGLAAIYGFQLSVEQTGAAVAAISALFAVVLRDRTSPQATLHA